METLDHHSLILRELHQSLDHVERKLSVLVFESAKKEWIGSKHLANELNISLRTLSRFREAGMPHARVGTKVFFPRKGVQEFLEQHMVG